MDVASGDRGRAGGGPPRRRPRHLHGRGRRCRTCRPSPRASTPSTGRASRSGSRGSRASGSRRLAAELVRAARERRTHGGRARDRPHVAVHGRGAARGPRPHAGARDRPRRVHPVDGHARASGRHGARGAGGRSASWTRPGKDLVDRGDRRRRPGRGRGGRARPTPTLVVRRARGGATRSRWRRPASWRSRTSSSVNKADRDGVGRGGPRPATDAAHWARPAAWEPPVVRTSATGHGEGIDELWAAIVDHRTYLESTRARCRRSGAPGCSREVESLVGGPVPRAAPPTALTRGRGDSPTTWRPRRVGPAIRAAAILASAEHRRDRRDSGSTDRRAAAWRTQPSDARATRPATGRRPRRASATPTSRRSPASR